MALVDELVALLKTASASAAWEAIGKQGDVASEIVAIVPGVLCAGPAFTVKAHPHRAGAIGPSLDHAPPGSVLVIDVGYDEGGCAFGGTGALAAQMAGIAGCVTNGRVRDTAEMRRLQFPVFARGATLRSGRKEPAAERGVPVVVGGQLVEPGDLVCGDDDGVVVIAQRHFPVLAQRLAERLAFEAEADRLVREGLPYGQAIARRPTFG